MKYERAAEWRRLFRVILGLTEREAFVMFGRLVEEGTLIKRRHGVWGYTFALQPELRSRKP